MSNNCGATRNDDSDAVCTPTHPHTHTVIPWYLSPSLAAQMVKRLPTTQETQVRSLSWDDPLGRAMAPHSSTLAWKIPWTEEHGRLLSMGSQRVGHD